MFSKINRSPNLFRRSESLIFFPVLKNLTRRYFSDVSSPLHTQFSFARAPVWFPKVHDLQIRRTIFHNVTTARALFHLLRRGSPDPAGHPRGPRWPGFAPIHLFGIPLCRYRMMRGGGIVRPAFSRLFFSISPHSLSTLSTWSFSQQKLIAFLPSALVFFHSKFYLYFHNFFAFLSVFSCIARIFLFDNSAFLPIARMYRALFFLPFHSSGFAKKMRPRIFQDLSKLAFPFINLPINCTCVRLNSGSFAPSGMRTYLDSTPITTVLLVAADLALGLMVVPLKQSECWRFEPHSPHCCCILSKSPEFDARSRLWKSVTQKLGSCAFLGSEFRSQQGGLRRLFVPAPSLGLARLLLGVYTAANFFLNLQISAMISPLQHWFPPQGPGMKEII